MKDELYGKILNEFVVLDSKIYRYTVVLTEKVKCTNKSVIKKEIRFGD